MSLGSQSACRRCGLVLGTNRGRCTTCFDAWADEPLAMYFDWLVRTCNRPDKMAECLAEHGPLLIPR